jgi:hypothetical protein
MEIIGMGNQEIAEMARQTSLAEQAKAQDESVPRPRAAALRAMQET